jgi:cyanophycin synthetase
MQFPLKISENRIFSGLFASFDQPATAIVIRSATMNPALPVLVVLDEGMAAKLATCHPQQPRPTPTAESLADWFLKVLEAFHKAAGSPVLSRPEFEIRHETASAGWEMVLRFPVLGLQHSATCMAVDWLVKLLACDEQRAKRQFEKDFDSVLALFRKQAPFLPGSCRFLEEAVALDIPWVHVTGNVYQYGWGSRARLLDGTFTESTPNIAVSIARNKLSAAHCLRTAGLPVPEHQPAGSLQQAVQIAESFGYPVVIKPQDQDGGAGVSANLRNSLALEKAWHRARVHSRHILVEQHCPGEDYRVYVLHGKVIAVWHRRPGGITGDGQNTVDALLEQVNSDPRRQPEAGRWYKISFDAEAAELLAEHGYGRDSVLPAGEFVPLRRTANVLTGGQPTEISLSAIHPDNLALCARAASILYLDLAGVDMISVDPGISWLDGGTSICEINAQPQMPPVIQKAILSGLVYGNGRIPVILVVDNRTHDGWLDRVIERQQALQRRAGVARADSVTLDGEILSRQQLDAPRGLHMLLRDPGTDIAIQVINNSAMLANGLPVDRCGLLVLSGITGIRGDPGVLAAALASRSETVWVDAQSPLWKRMELGHPDLDTVQEDQLTDKLCDWLESRA